MGRYLGSSRRRCCYSPHYSAAEKVSSWSIAATWHVVSIMPDCSFAHQLDRLKLVSDIEDSTAVTSSPTFRHPLPGYRLHFLSAMLLPWAGVHYFDTKQKKQAVSVHILREALKFRTKDSTQVTTILGLCSRFRAITSIGCQASRYYRWQLM